ncbi:MAG TPA: AAA family ATPase [Amycolatopsis sp.]|nr:AAA family ATPase [Amycolatopsis sp.]
MRDNMRREVMQISDAVAREVFTHSSLMEGVSREVHARLPETIRQHAYTVLPDLARIAVASVTPDPAEVRAALLDQLHEAFDADARDLVAGAAKNLLPELAADAAREAAPDTEEVRLEVVRGASDAVRAVLEEAAPSAAARAIEDLRDSMTEAVKAAASEILPELARRAIGRLTPDLQELRDQARADAAKAVADEAGEAVPAAVENALASTVAAARTVVERAERRARENIDTAVREAVDEKLAEFTPNIIEVVLPAGKRVKLGFDAHAVLPELLVALNARCHVLLVGPAGTGKSMLARHAAHALDIEFHALSLGPTTPMSKIFGYFDAHGHYHDTPFRRAFEHGGVMLLDELDNGHAGLLAELNQALALGTCAFPDGMIDAHDDFRLVATGNTYGTGGDRQYVGRQTLDSATLDRFVVIDVPIDEDLEERITLRHAPSHEDAARELLDRIRDLRDATEDKKLPIVFSPRASIDGAKLLEAGATVEQVMQWRVVRGLSAAHRKALDLD